MSGQWAATLGSFCDGGRSASGPAWRWPICRHCLGVSRRHIDHRLAGGLDGGRCATAGPRPYGADRPPSTWRLKRRSMRRRDTPAKGRQIDHRQAGARVDRPPSVDHRVNASALDSAPSDPEL